MKNYPLRFYLILALIFLLLSSCGSNQGTLDNQGSTQGTADGETGISQPDGDGIMLTSGTELSRSDLSRLGADFGADIREGWNYFYDVEGVEVQVNWLNSENSDDLRQIFYTLFNSVGQTNAVLMGDEAVFEVITSDAGAGLAMVDFLQLTPLQDIKFIPHRIYGHGMMLRDEIITGRELEGVELTLGIDIDVLLNQEIELDGTPWRVNFILPGGRDTAEDAYEALENVKDTDIGLYIVGDAVVEVVTSRRDVADLVHTLITGEPIETDTSTSADPDDASTLYRLSFTVVPIINVDYMRVNECSIALGEGAGIREINEIDPALYLGDTLQFFTNEESTLIETDPDNTMERVDDSIAVATVEFGRQADFNAGDLDVNVTMEVRTGRILDIEPDNIDLYIRGTDFWPVGTRRVQDAVDDALEDIRTRGVRGTVEVLHGWVRENIDYGGDVIGSRWGTNQVLRQGEGRCWDHSDVFISMARTAGIPARQIAGWLYDVDSGHVWSQVWLEDEGIWLDVDTTAETVGVDDTYIPIWGTRDGEMLFLYKTTPDIQIVR